MDKKGNILMDKYEVGKLLGHGTFAKVHHAKCLETGQSVAIKIINKEKITTVGLKNQIKREISIMRLIKHPNVVQLYEVMATKSKIYFVMEYVKGGELFNKVAKGRLKENAARKYFQQLIAAVDFCHSRNVYHRDLKLENLLLDEFGNLKVSDFGLSALLESKRQDGLLHTTCGTPAYVAPEVINKKGYDGEKADIWSCGIILFALMAGYLPFQDSNVIEMYRKIQKGEFKCPHWFSVDVQHLQSKILDPNPFTRTTISNIMENPWFKTGFQHIKSMNLFDAEEDSPRSILDVVDSDSDASSPSSRKEDVQAKQCFNAFDIISLSSGFDLSGLFQKDKTGARFMTKMHPTVVLDKLGKVNNFKVKKKDGMVMMQGSERGRKGELMVDVEIFEVASSLHVVEMKKISGDTVEYNKFCDQELRPSLKDIVWSWESKDFA